MSELEPAPAPAPTQAVTDLHIGDIVYVDGFGGLEYQGSNHCEYRVDLYKPGNKIGIMGRPQKMRRINKEIAVGALLMLSRSFVYQFDLKSPL